MARITFVALIVLTLAFQVLSQTEDENDPAKAAAILRDCIKARGGDAYLNIQNVIGRGVFTPYDKGVSTRPEPFIDYVIYPDKERTEFSKGDRKYIQTNINSAGWVYDAQKKTISDQKEDQIKRWQQGNRYDIDFVLRQGWQEKGVTLKFLGRREAWRDTFTDIVQLDYADGGTVKIHINPRTNLPVMTEYKGVPEEGPAEEQIKFFQWVDLNGVKFPFIIDSFRAGKQTIRVNYETLEYNAKIQEKLFQKPPSVKEVK